MDKNGNVIPVKGSTSTVPNAFKIAWITRIAADAQLAMVNRLLLPTEAHRTAKKASATTERIIMQTMTNPHSSHKVAITMSASLEKILVVRSQP